MKSISVKAMDIKTVKTDNENVLGIVITLEDEFGRHAEICSNKIRIGDVIHMSFGSMGGISLSDRFNENTN